MTPPSGFSPQGPRNLLCTILFLDLVGYSARSVDQQARIKERLTALVSQVLRDIPPDSRLSIDTGDGAALCFLGDPQAALQAARLLRDLLAQRYGASLPVRIGLHLGPVRVVSDINGRINLVGDGINVARRILDFAQPQQILVSRACFDVMSRLGDEAARGFQPAGACRDKHGRLHELHAVVDVPVGTHESAQAYRATRLAAPRLVALERALVRHVGPLARLLLEQAADADAAWPGLVENLAAHIASPGAREAFRQEGRRILSAPDQPPLNPPGAPPPR